jgi:hypothetical protein
MTYPAPAEPTRKNQTLFEILVFAAVFLLPWWLYFRALRRLRAAQAQAGALWAPAGGNQP